MIAGVLGIDSALGVLLYTIFISHCFCQIYESAHILERFYLFCVSVRTAAVDKFEGEFFYISDTDRVPPFGVRMT